MGENEKTDPGVHPLLLDILVCPACHTPVRLLNNSLLCLNPACRRRYPVRDGIPIMLIDEAEIIPENDLP